MIRCIKNFGDMGSMVSVINKHWLKSNFPNEKIFSSEEFLGTPFGFQNREQYQTKYSRCSCVRFFLKLMSVKVKVPFIVTTEYLENPTFGYNLIEHFFQGTI